jgi:hypothetical protein
VSLSGGLQQYQIPAEKISVSAISDALGQIEVAWSSDTVTKENVQLALTADVGLSGAATFVAAGEGLPAQEIPVRVHLADPDTLGVLRWQRDAPVRNETPYPLRLETLHLLLVEKGVPIVYSWSLDGVTLAPGARLEIDGAAVPSWLDARTRRAWIQYAALGDCASCDQRVIAQITGGAATTGASQITFHTITPLADVGAHEIGLTVRSRYFDPAGAAVQTKAPLPLTADNQDFPLGPLYLGTRQPGESIPGDPLFEYRLEVVMPDGTQHRGTRWIPSDSLRVLIGRAQLDAALGTALPRPTPAPAPEPPNQ